MHGANDGQNEDGDCMWDDPSSLYWMLTHDMEETPLLRDLNDCWRWCYIGNMLGLVATGNTTISALLQEQTK